MKERPRPVTVEGYYHYPGTPYYSVPGQTSGGEVFVQSKIGISVLAEVSHLQGAFEPPPDRQLRSKRESGAPFTPVLYA